MKSFSQTPAAVRRKRSSHSFGGRCAAVSRVGELPKWWAFSPLRLMASVKSASTPMTGSIGTGLSTPPSTSRRPFTMIGVIIAGIAIDALIAVSSGPLVNQTSRRAPRSLATAV